LYCCAKWVVSMRQYCS